MKKLFTLILIFFCITIQAQDDDDQLFALKTTAFTLGPGTVKILDPYLSPFEYSGYQLRLQNNARKFYNPENDKLSYTHRGLLDGGLAYHPSRNNSMMFFNLNYSYGVNYHFRPAKNLMILTGGNWEFDVGGKYLARNVNNPFSLDLFTNINATAEIQYVFKLWKQDFSLQYGAQSPLFGYMFVPLQGITYYEIFMLKNLNSSFHFSSLHNKRGLSQYINLDIPTNITTFRVSLQHDFVRYSANDLTFRKSGFNLSVGTVIDLHVFSGKKRKYPSNFIRSYE